MSAIARWLVLCLVLAVPLHGFGQSPREELLDTSRTQTERPNEDTDAAESTVPEGRQASRDEENSDRESSTFSVDLFAKKGIGFSFGLGDPEGIAAIGEGGGAFQVGQSLSVQFQATALECISVVAEVDDQKSTALQSLAVYLDTEKLDGVLGDFDLERFGSAVVDRPMLGLKADYTPLPDLRVSGFASAPEGKAMSREFKGEAGTDTVLFSRYKEVGEWEYSAYRFQLDGLAAFSLTDLFVEGFTDVRIALSGKGKLDDILLRNGIRTIQPDLEQGDPFEVSSGAYTILPGDRQILVMLSDPLSVMRQLVQSAISAHNSRTGETITYPFVENSSSDLAFLEDLYDCFEIVVGDGAYRLESAIWRQYYLLNRSGVVDDSVRVAASDDGVSFYAIDASQSTTHTIQLYAEQGIVRIVSPESFFSQSNAMIRVEFSYSLVMGFSLGVGDVVIPGSERVYLNGELLEPDTDYVMDYEMGLVSFTGSHEIRESDVVRIDFEVYGGSAGDGSEYATYVYGAHAEFPILGNGQINLGVAHSSQYEASTSDAARLSTLPNSHTVVWADLDIDFDMGLVSVETGYCWDEAPFDRNTKPAIQNSIGCIASTDQGMVFFGHAAGLTMYDGLSWHSYGAASHLPSTRVQALVVDDQTGILLIGTDQGLSVVTLEGMNPLDFVDNWSTYRMTSGLPANDISALVITRSDVLYVGTSDGLVSIDMQDVNAGGPWTRHNAGQDADTVERITVLRESDWGLVVGTENGAYILDDHGETISPIDATQGQAIFDVLVFGSQWLVASDDGLREYVGGYPERWIYEDGAVYCLATDGDSVWYGTSQGLMSVSSRERMHEGSAVTGLHWQEGSGLWTGTQGGSSSGPTIWLYGEQAYAFESDVTKIPEDDPSRYQNVPLAERLAEGAAVSASITQWSDNHRLEVDVYQSDSGFRQIGSIQRFDENGWALKLEADVGHDVEIDIQHQYTIGGQRSDDLSSTSNEASLWWRDASMTVSWEGVNCDSFVRGLEEFAFLLAADVDQWHLWDGGLAVDLSWEYGSAKARQARRATTNQTAELALEWSPWSALDVSGSWIGDWNLLGGERREFSSTVFLDCSLILPVPWSLGDLETIYEAKGQFGGVTTDADWNHEGSVSWRLPSLSRGDWCLVSGLIEGTWELSDQQGYSALADGEVTVGLWNIDARVRHTRAQLPNGRVDLSDVGFVRITTNGWDLLKPSISATATDHRYEYETRTRETLDVDFMGIIDWKGLPEGVADRIDIRWDASFADGTAKSHLVKLSNNYSSDVSTTVREWLSRMMKERVAEGASFRLTARGGITYSASGGDSGEVVLDAVLGVTAKSEVGWTCSVSVSSTVGQRTSDDWFSAVLVKVDLEIPFTYSEHY